MAKKKSKTQKLKKNLKEKQKKLEKKRIEETAKLKKVNESGAVVAPITKKAVKTQTKKNITEGQKKLVSKEQVSYNVAINKEKPKAKSLYKKNKNESKNVKKKILVPKEKVQYKNIVTKEENQKSKNTKSFKNILNKIKHFFITIIIAIAAFSKKIYNKIKKVIETYKLNRQEKNKQKKVDQIIKNNLEDYDEEDHLEEDIDKKEAIKKEEIKKKNIFVRIAYAFVSNRHIFFNAVLILFFIVLLIGLKAIDSITKGTIIYISCIAIFLMTVAISYNKYLSGKIFTIVLCSVMGFAIYKMQYTYDFIRSLNSNVYEYKTYYVVTFNNNQNKSIYNINNKKIGLYKENTTNIERKLNTKLNKINYVEYDDLNELFEDFYDQRFRAVLVNENQYKYMKNYISENARDVKILYEFKVNSKK